jgi:anti-sigma factor (TIGR02949 family)
VTDCGCEQAKHDLEEYLHHELARREYADITEHLMGCLDCAQEARIGVLLTEAVKRACRDTAPETLREQIITRLQLTVVEG